MTALDIIYHFYPEDTPLRRLLLLHSQCVAQKALSLLLPPSADLQLIYDGAMLHDIGICQCHAPSIFCEGSEPYICHGTIGAEMLRAYLAELENQKVKNIGIDLEACARICERHTGAGLTAQNILDQGLPISPVRDLLPETLEEKAICLADKFYSKSGDPSREKELIRVRQSIRKFGEDSINRFEALCTQFCV